MPHATPALRRVYAAATVYATMLMLNDNIDSRSTCVTTRFAVVDAHIHATRYAAASDAIDARQRALSACRAVDTHAARLT